MCFVSIDRRDKGRDDSEGTGVPQPQREDQAGRGQEAGAGAAQVTTASVPDLLPFHADPDLGFSK